MQHVKNAIGGNAMKMLKMHQNALKCTRMRMGKINTTFGKKQHLSLHSPAPEQRPGVVPSYFRRQNARILKSI